MDIPQIYAVSLGCLLLLYIIIYILSSIANVRIYGTVYFFKYLYYPQVPQFIGYPRQTTWFEVAILIAFLVGNATCMALNVDGISGFIKRSGLICTINIIPLALGAQMNLAVDSCNMKLTTYGRIHRWLGRVTIIEGLIHAVAAVLFYGHDLLARADVAALITASIAILAILFSGLLRRHVYEVYINLHQLLAVLIVSATYFHMTRRKLFEFPTIYLLAAVCLQIIVGAMRFGQVLYRNFKHRKPLNRALVQTIIYKRGSKRAIPVSDAVHVHIRLTRPWKPQAGQYVYLSIPGVSSTSFAQSHPFYVSWWYNDVAGANIVLIIQKRKGFTKDLFLHADKYINSGYEMRSGIGSENDIGSNIEDDSEMELFIGDRFKMRAIVEGPYGKELQLDSYGTVLLFATGIGIAGQLPYITRLLEGYRNCEVKTRRIALFWEVESELHTAWVAKRMKKLLKEDTDRILDIHLFILGDPLSKETKRGTYVRISKRIDMLYDAMDVREIIEPEIRGRKGRAVVSLCTNDDTSRKIRQIVSGMLEEDIHLQELEFRPYKKQQNLMKKLLDSSKLWWWRIFTWCYYSFEETWFTTPHVYP